MAKVFLSSRALAAVTYDHALRTLEVEMRNGEVFGISDVPDAVYQTLIAAPSPGTYYHLHIRKGGYEITQLR